MADDDGTTKNVVVFGTGMVSEVISVYLEKFSDLKIVGYTVDREFMPEDNLFNGLPTVAWDEIEDHYPPNEVQLIGPLTYQRLNQIRKDRYLEGKAKGYAFASFIHPASHVLTNQIGDHVIILEQNVIQPFASIGNNVILWSNNHIGHHTSIGDHCFLASYVGISGSVKIGEQCYLGGQTGVVHGLEIGARCVTLNAAVVKETLPDDTVIVGPPSDKKPFPSSKLAKLL